MSNIRVVPSLVVRLSWDGGDSEFWLDEHRAIGVAMQQLLERGVIPHITTHLCDRQIAAYQEICSACEEGLSMNPPTTGGHACTCERED